MKRVSFSKPIELFSGRIGLTNAQASVRTHSLKLVSKGVYEITGKVEFKAGEQIELESTPKSLITVNPVEFKVGEEISPPAIEKSDIPFLEDLEPKKKAEPVEEKVQEPPKKTKKKK